MQHEMYISKLIHTSVQIFCHLIAKGFYYEYIHTCIYDQYLNFQKFAM